MATRYWVGGTGNWDASTTTNWSATSGGASGASAPTATDDAVFDSGSGGGASGFYFPSVITGATCQNLTISRASSILGVVFQTGASGSQTIAITGNFSVLTNLCSFGSFSGGQRITLKFTSTTSGKTLSVFAGTTLCSVDFDGVGGVWSLSTAVTTSTTDTVSLTRGELNINSQILTVGNFSSSNTNVRILTFGTSGSISAKGTTFDCATSTNLTINNAATSSVAFTQTSGTKVFAGGGKTWGIVAVPGTAVTVTGSNTYSSTFRTNTFVPMTLTFAASSTQTFLGGVEMSGTLANALVINSSTPGTQATLSQAGGLALTVNYANIKDSNATGGQSWVAYNSTDSGNNVGWAFPVASRGSMMMFC